MCVLQPGGNFKSEPLYRIPGFGEVYIGDGSHQHPGPARLLQEGAGREGQAGCKECPGASNNRLLFSITVRMLQNLFNMFINIMP